MEAASGSHHSLQPDPPPEAQPDQSSQNEQQSAAYRPRCCSNQEEAVLIYQAKFRLDEPFGRQTRSDSLKMEAAGHKSMRALRQSIRRHETRAKQRRNSVALRPETLLQVPQQVASPARSPSPMSLTPEPPPVGCRARGRAALSRCWERVTRVAWTERNPLPEDPACWERLCFGLMCPPHGHVARCTAGILSVLVLYGLLFVIVGDSALPSRCVMLNSLNNLTSTTTNGTAVSSLVNDSSTESSGTTAQKELCTGGNFFGLFVLFVCSMTASSLSKKLNLPPLLGMLVVGCVLGNAPVINVARHISKEYFNKLRELALCTILLRAGLSLDPNTLRRLSATVFRLAFIPCLVESTVGAIAAFFILGFPWEWGFILGFVLGAVSPAVVVLGMLKLEYRGYGVEKGIPTLIIAASSMDDVLAITGFSLALGIASNDGDRSIAGAIFRGPRDAIIGIVYGGALGALLWFIPHKQHKRPVMFRFIFLVGGGVIALLGCEKAHVQGAGALGVLTLAFVSGYGWRRWDGWAEEDNPMLAPLDTLWWFMQPMLFGLIGGQILFEKIHLLALAKGLAVVGIGLVFRMLASFLCMMGTNLNFRERLFIPFSWLPKATVQAAIGPVALDMALAKEPRNKEAVDMALQILTIAAIVIMLTAPLGAFLISLLGPRLLERDKNWEMHHFDLSAHNCHGHGGHGAHGHGEEIHQNRHGLTRQRSHAAAVNDTDLEAMQMAVAAVGSGADDDGGDEVVWRLNGSTLVGGASADIDLAASLRRTSL